MNNPVLLPLLICLLLPAACCDIRRRSIPNALCLAGCAAGLLFASLQGLPALGASALGMAVAFGLTFPLWLCRWLGAGDVKLLTAVGALAGIVLLPRILLCTALSGGVLALLVLLLRRGELLAVRQRLQAWLVPAHDAPPGIPAAAPRYRLPYAVAIALGSLLALLLPAGLPLPA
jgi:prepilin peptidase CpaA